MVPQFHASWQRLSSLTQLLSRISQRIFLNHRSRLNMSAQKTTSWSGEDKTMGTRRISLMRELAPTRVTPYSSLLHLSNNHRSSQISNYFFSNIQSSFNTTQMLWNSINNNNRSQWCNRETVTQITMPLSFSMKMAIKMTMMRIKRTKKANSLHSLQGKTSINSSSITSNSNN
jgi:hypothetical protein